MPLIQIGSKSFWGHDSRDQFMADLREAADVQQRELARGVKYMERQYIATATSGGLLTIPNPETAQLMAPDQGYVWSIRRISLYAAPGANNTYAQGSASAPTAGSPVADLSAANLYPGLWQFTVTTQESGTLVSATDINNMQFVYGTSANLNVSKLIVNPTANTSQTAGPFTFYFPPGSTILDPQVQAVANASASSVYAASITATPVNPSGSPGGNVGLYYASADGTTRIQDFITSLHEYPDGTFLSSNSLVISPGRGLMVSAVGMQPSVAAAVTLAMWEVPAEMAAKAWA